jgi:hypothetical protein
MVAPGETGGNRPRRAALRNAVRTGSGRRGEQSPDVGELRLGRALALLDHVGDVPRAVQADGALELRQDRDDLGVVREVVEGEAGAQQVVGLDAVELEGVADRRADPAGTGRLDEQPLLAV